MIKFVETEHSCSIHIMSLFQYIDKGSGSAVLFLHGLFSNLTNFEKSIEHFSKSYRVVAPQLPILEMPLKSANVDGLVEYLEKFVEQLNLDSFIIVGNSLGGHVGIEYALRNSEQVNGLVLSGSSGLFEKESPSGEFPKRQSYEYIQDKLLHAFYDPTLVTSKMVDDIYETVNDRTKAIRVLSVAKSAIQNNIGNRLCELRSPVMLIWGENDQITPPSIAKRFKKFIPQAQLEWVKNCGHMAMVECPKVFNQLLEDFLRSYKKIV